MVKKVNLRKSAVALLVSAGLLGGCGGGSSGSSGTPASTSVSGVAATGAALAGATVTLKDLNGQTRTAVTGLDGSYSVSAAGLAAPFLLKAVGLDNTTVYSAALASDVGGRINITPLSSLVVGNAAGESPATLFAGYGAADAVELTANLGTAVERAVMMLDPVFDALGVEPSTAGLLRGSFAADHSGLDMVLDAITVTIAGDVATITDKAGTPIATDDLTSPDTVIATVGAASEASLLEYADAAAGIAQLLADITAHCGTPAVSSTVLCLAHFDSINLLHESHTSAIDLTDGIWLDIQEIDTRDYNLINRAGNDSISYSNPVIVGKSDIGYKARFTLLASDGTNSGIFFLESWFFQDAADGSKWKFRGDQQTLWLDVHHNSLQNYFDITAKAYDAWPTGIAYLIVTGPGLPEGGLKLDQPAFEDGFNNFRTYKCMKLTGDASSSCGGTEVFTGGALLGSNQQYTFTAYDSSDAELPAHSGTYWLYLRDEPEAPDPT